MYSALCGFDAFAYLDIESLETKRNHVRYCLEVLVAAVKLAASIEIAFAKIRECPLAASKPAHQHGPNTPQSTTKLPSCSLLWCECYSSVGCTHKRHQSEMHVPYVSPNVTYPDCRREFRYIFMFVGTPIEATLVLSKVSTWM